MRIFFIPGTPIGQPRHRIAKRGDHVGRYIPSDHPIHTFKATLMMAAREAGCLPLHGPVFLRVTALFPRQTNKVWKKRAMPRYRHTTRPDLDNIVKAVKDALKGICWVDDSQVARLEADKYHVADKEPCGVAIEIEELEDSPIPF